MRSLQEIMDTAMQAAKIAAEQAAGIPAAEPPAEAVAAAAEWLIGKGYLPHDQQAFAALATFLARRKAGGSHRLRGLWMFGPAGTGKTFFLTVAGLSNNDSVVSAYDVVSAYKQHEEGGDEFWRAAVGQAPHWWSHGPARFYLDDVGQEPVCVNYGERLEVLDMVLSRLYTAWKADGCLLHLSTNLTPDGLDTRYGRRFTDRLREMCYCIEIKGGSRRGA